VEVKCGNQRLRRPKINREHEHVTVERQHRWSAPSRPQSGRAFDDPTLCEQLLNNLRDGAGLKTRFSGKFYSGYRLTCSDQFEDNISIDMPGRATRREL
jgi:hypothetical protein